MPRTIPPVRVWLYAPGNNAKLLNRVFTAGADGVILDLEDAVPRSEKARAREMVSDTLGQRQGQPGPAISVRVNHPETGLTAEDVAAVVQPGLDVLRLPKMEHPQTVREIDRLVAEAEQSAGLPAGQIAFICSIETAVGIWNVLDVARSSARIISLSFGEVDFLRDIHSAGTPDRRETLYARSRIVLASRVAGLQPPGDSVFPHLNDEEALARTTREAKAMGFFGRSAIHPRQLDVIRQVFTPSEEELGWARSVLEAAEQAEARGSGAIQLPSGEFVDAPVAQRARHILELADSVGEV